MSLNVFTYFTIQYELFLFRHHTVRYTQTWTHMHTYGYRWNCSWLVFGLRRLFSYVPFTFVGTSLKHWTNSLDLDQTHTTCLWGLYDNDFYTIKYSTSSKPRTHAAFILFYTTLLGLHILTFCPHNVGFNFPHVLTHT